MAALEALREKTDQRIDVILGRLLRTGVILSAMFVLAGGVLYLLHHAAPATDYHVFRGEPGELRRVPGILHEAAALHGRGLIQLGLLMLIATPIARVLFSVLAFAYERDWFYVLVTLVVLCLLTYSLFGRHA
jgi:uncharacterized membrane protein